MKQQTTHLRLSLLASFTLGSLLACTGVDHGGSSGGAGGGIDSGEGLVVTGGAAGGGNCDSIAPPRTVLCAGSYWEQSVVTQASAYLATLSASWACNQDNYYPYPYPSGPVPTDECEGDCYPLDTPPEADGGVAGGLGMGGAGGWIGVGGGWVGTGGLGMGGVDGGGTGGAPIGGPISDWCDDLTWDAYIAGISFAHGTCQASELRTPIRFQEPHGFYEIVVYAGDSACDRGELVQSMAGYGTGELIELPPFQTDAAYVSIEINGDGYVETAIEHQSLGAARTFVDGE